MTTSTTARKLVLFDIDGTLVRATQKGIEAWKGRIKAVFEEVHGMAVPFELEVKDFNGMVDKKVLWLIAQRLGIAREVFEKKFGQSKKVFHRYLRDAVKHGEIAYFPIEEARILVKLVQSTPTISFGLITGNIEDNAWLKLQSAGIEQDFGFGVFGDVAEERVDLVRQAVASAQNHFGHAFAPADVFVIGDTTHDINAAKAAGVISVGVATGHTDTAQQLQQAGAHLVVDSLMDARVLALLGLRKHG